MRVLTFNIWGLPAPLARPPRHWRFPKLRRFVDDSGADIVALQELWRFPLRPRDFDDAIAAPVAQGDSGLALLTRHGVDAIEHGSFAVGAVGAVDRSWSRKGWQRASLTNGVTLVNTHLHAYAGDDDAALRSAQIDELLDVTARIVGPVLMVGDFNVYAHIDSDQRALARIASAGFVDAAAPHDATLTYDRDGEHERFDRVFARGLTPTSARVVTSVSALSDHRPVQVSF
ncbi:MAG TPA: endonuclease/exonuclease/phosphatase family protein [Myxococcota bacterium]|jgi:endonuclease/exonuclease/phosphatase family metal-dependent hydrolase